MIKPLRDFVLVELAPEEKVTNQGVIIAPNSEIGQAPIMLGTVVAVGPGVYSNGIFIDTKVKTGQKVYVQKQRFPKHPGAPEGKEYCIGLEENIWSIVED